jgi:hypothetical protein
MDDSAIRSNSPTNRGFARPSGHANLKTILQESGIRKVP